MEAASASGKQDYVGRHARRKARTHARLLEAARAVFAEKGFETTSIAEIAERADVGLGSVYYHFSSKEQILEAVLTEMLVEQTALLRTRQVGIDDAAEALSIAHRHYIVLAQESPELAWLLIRLDDPWKVMDAAIHDDAMQDVQRGIEAGTFDVPNPELSLQASGGALLAAMHTVLVRGGGDEPDAEHAEWILRAFGVPAKRAAKIARRPLPPAKPASD